MVGHEAPGLLPSAGDLAWEAEMGEETAVDTACAELDRAARLLLDDDGHAPGTRVRMLTGPHPGHLATIVGVVWGSGGPPPRYRVQPDGRSATLADPADLVVLAGQSRY